MKFFSSLYKGRINRRNFVLGCIISYFAAWIIIFFASLLTSLLIFSTTLTVIAGLIASIFFILNIYFIISLCVRRLHDLGRSGFLLLLVFVPIAQIIIPFYLLLASGQIQDNAYGKIPTEKIRFPNDILGFNIFSFSMKLSLKTFLGIILGLAVLVVSSSIAYYFIFFLPEQNKNTQSLREEIEKLHKEVSNTRDVVGNGSGTPNISQSEIQDRLDEIQSAIDEQQWENEHQTNCESNGGRYLGNSMCIYD